MYIKTNLFTKKVLVHFNITYGGRGREGTSLHNEMNSTDHISTTPPSLPLLSEMYNVCFSVSHYWVIHWAPCQFIQDEFPRKIPP